MTRLLSVLALLTLTSAIIPAAPVPVVPPDPLPKGATARLGSLMYRGPHAVGLTFSTDGKRLLAQDDQHQLLVWDTDTGKRLATRSAPPPEIHRFVAARGNVKSVVTGDRVIWLAQAPPRAQFPSEVIVCDLDGKVLSRFDVEGAPYFDIEVHHEAFGAASVTPDGRYLATTIAGDESAELVAYDLTSGERRRLQKLQNADRLRVVCSRDCSTLFVSQQGKSIRRYKLATGKELPPLEGSDHEIWQAQTSPDGKWVVTGKLFRTNKTVGGKVQQEVVEYLEVRDGPTGKLVGRLDVGGIVQHFAFVGNDSLITSAQKSRPPAYPVATLSRWNMTTLKREWAVPGFGTRIAVSPDRKLFTSQGSQIHLYDTATGKLLIEPNGHSGPIGWATFSSDGTTVTTAGGSAIITWGMKGEQKLRATVPELRGAHLIFSAVSSRGLHFAWRGYTEDERVTPALFGWDQDKNAIGWRVFAEHGFPDPVATPDGKRVVRVRADQNRAGDTVTVYDGPTGKVVKEWRYDRPAKLGNAPWPKDLSGDGRFVLVGDGESVLVYDALTGREESRVKLSSGKPRPPSDVVPTLAASANGSRLGVMDRGLVEVYDIKSGKVLAQHTFPKEYPRRMKLSADGKRLVMWSVIGSRGASSVFVWDLDAEPTVPQEFVAEPWAQATCAAFSPNGASLVVGYQDGTALVWDLTAK
jgi:WD40 repeat protein